MTAPTLPRKPVRADAPLTVDEVCGVLKISRSTFYDWRAKGTGPRSFRLPNGQVRVKPAELDRWIAALEEGVA